MPSPRLRHEAIFLLVFALDLVNMFIATVAYPALAAELHADVGTLAWVGTAYMLGLSVVIPLAPWLAARCGERRLLLVALLLFAIAAALAGAAPGIGWLLGWRLLQGLAGGLLIPVAQAAAYRQCTPDQRGALTRRILLVALLVPALAPALGGLLVQWLSWRGVLWASLPLALMAIGLVLAWMPADVRRTVPRLQAHALTTAMAALGALLLALTWLGEPGHRLAGSGLLMVAVVLAVVHLRHARRQPQPLLRWSLLSHRSLRLAMLVYLAVPGVFIGSQLVSTLQLHQAGYSAARIGALMLPWALASAIAITASKRLLARFGPAAVLRAGMFLQASGLLAMALLPQPAFALAGLLFALMGAGGSLCSSTAQTLAFHGVEGEALGDASALWNLNRQLSFCLGTARHRAAAGTGHAVASGPRHWRGAGSGRRTDPAADAAVASAEAASSSTPWELMMDTTAEHEIHHLHDKLQAWFRAEVGIDALDDLMAHFCADFSMVGIAGRRLDRIAVQALFAGGHGARPGLQISIDAVQAVEAPSPLAVLRYREGHAIDGGEPAWRESLAVLRQEQEQGRWCWLALHEVAA